MQAASIQVESQFRIHKVTSDATKYHLVVATLGHKTITDVSGIIRNPPALEN